MANKKTKSTLASREDINLFQEYPSFVENIRKVTQGQVCIVEHAPEIPAIYVQLLIENVVLNGRTIAGMEFSKIESLTALITGPSNHWKASASMRAYDSKKADAYSALQISNKSQFSFCSTEGISAIVANTKEGQDECISFHQRELRLDTADSLDALKTIAQIAKKQKKLFLIFTTSKDFDVNDLGADHYQHHFTITDCVPDPDATIAYAIECKTLKYYLVPKDQQKTLIQAKWEQGKFKTKYSPFTGKDPESRQIWKLANQGKTVTEIAKIVGKDKSNISRALAKLPSKTTRNDVCTEEKTSA